MTAGDHLSTDQFEILHPHRSVRIGERTFPAAVTDELGPPHQSTFMRGAMIPMENGSLAYVEHDKEGFGINQPDHQMRDASGSPHGGTLFYPSHSMTTPEQVHATLDRLSQKQLTPEQHSTNRKILEAHRKSRDSNGPPDRYTDRG
jgi:hypothetical protein